MTVEVLVALGILAVAVGALVTWRLVRRARRGLDYMRRRSAEARIRFLPPGPRRDAAVLRLDLAAEIRAARELFATKSGRIFRADAGVVLADLTAAAADLDDALRIIDTLPDRAQQRAALTSVLPQVRQLIDTSSSARRTMMRTAELDRERKLQSLSTSIAHQADALATYERASTELSI